MKLLQHELSFFSLNSHFLNDTYTVITASYSFISSYSLSDAIHIPILIGSAWIMALVISLPMHIDYPGFSTWSQSFDGESTSCAPINDPGSAGYSIFSAILGFILPAIVIIVLNVAIVLKMRIRSELKISRIQKMVILIKLIQPLSTK